MSSYLNSVTIRGKQLYFPTFFPDATRGVIRSIDSADLEGAKVEGLIVNTYHLMSQPGASIFKVNGGIKQLMNWNNWIISDSGGFQLLSMIYQNKSFGTISNDGVTFQRGSKGKKERYKFTPEKSIEVQFAINSDIMICLDDCPAINAKEEDLRVSVDRTIAWAVRSKQEYEKQIQKRRIENDQRPFLFGVIQGGNNRELRAYCAEELIKIGFDGFGFGGWPLDENREFDNELLSDVANLMPNNLPKYALGVGNPQAIVDCFKMGYTIFDCVLPTRDARHQRLYNFVENPQTMDLLNTNPVYENLHIMKEQYTRDFSPISLFCDCYTCQNYTKSYLKHLFTIEDSLAWRLATIHNLRMYTRLIEKLRLLV